MVGEGDEHGLEDPQFARTRTALSNQPEGELTEADLTHQLAGEVVAEQRDRVRIGVADRGGVLAHSASSVGSRDDALPTRSFASSLTVLLLAQRRTRHPDGRQAADASRRAAWPCAEV